MKEARQKRNYIYTEGRSREQEEARKKKKNFKVHRRDTHIHPANTNLMKFYPFKFELILLLLFVYKMYYAMPYQLPAFFRRSSTIACLLWICLGAHIVCIAHPV